MGYLSYDDFMKLPAGLLNYIIGIRKADFLKELKGEQHNTKDKDQRKKLANKIRDLEAFFNG